MNRPAKIMFTLVILGITYNAILALINNFLFEISNGLVILTEISVLGVSLAVVFTQSKLLDKDKYVVFLFFSVLFSSMIIFLSTQIVFIDAIRNILIICVFFLIGSRFCEEHLHKLFLCLSLVIAFFLIIEIVMLGVYVGLFEPALYYQNTRGVEIKEWNQTGVFGNAEGFEGRFSFGIFSGPRTSSIFLEQVGLANFCTILGVYFMVFQIKLTNKIRIFYICLILLICLSNETRVGSFLALILFVIAQFRAHIPAYSNLVVPLTVMLIGFFITGFFGEVTGDNFLGRINMGFGRFIDLAILDYLGLGVLKLNHLWDSGFGYLFASYTVFGGSVFIYFTLFILKQTSIESRLCALGLSIYIFANLMIGGNAIYSIKTAALLWLMVGFIYNNERKKMFHDLRHGLINAHI
jgi:hypothetical protein